MTHNKKYCFSDGQENASCPNCGRSMKTIDYYTARPLRQEERPRDLNTKTVITTYTDISHRQGNICFFCAHENMKNKRIAGLILLIVSGVASGVSMLAGLVLSTIAQNNGQDVGAALGLPMALMCIFLVLAIIGLCVFLGSNSYNPNRNYNQDQLFLLFTKSAYKEYPLGGLVYLAPWQVKQMRKN